MLAASGRLAEMSEQTKEALQHYEDLVRMGHEIRRGGLIIDLLVGVACEAIGLNALNGLVSQLDASQCQDLVQKLETIEAKREPDKILFDAEQRWAKRTFRWRWAVLRLLKPGMLKAAVPKTLEKVHNMDMQRRQLMLEAAVRAYELEKGSRPRALSDLIPSYFKGIPLDPETGRPMNYPL